MNLVAEQSVIGCLYLDSNCISEISETINPEMFTDSLLGAVYLEFLRGYENRYEVNPAVIVNKLGQKWSEHTLNDMIVECTDKIISTVYVKSYAEAVRDDWMARQLDTMLQRTVANPANVRQQLGQLMTDIESLMGGRKTSGKTMPEIVRDNKDNYFREKEPGIMLGFEQLDELLGGLEGGDMVVIGARPSVGKSAFVTQVIANLAQNGKRICYYNLEMTESQVYERFVSALSGIGLTRVRRAISFTGDEQERFNAANEILEKQDNLRIVNAPRKMSEIRAETRHMEYDLIIIDYLQLLQADTTYRGNRYAEVGEISRAIKTLAMELKIPIIALSQLNRAPEARDTKEPTMADIREAGNIEQDAGTILLMWNSDAEDDRRKKLKVEKNRQGKKGTIDMIFDGDLMRFRELDGWETPKGDIPF